MGTAARTAGAIILLATVSSAAYADSPLTSTPFHEAYMDLPVINRHVGSVMNRDIYGILRSEEYPIHVKAALINAMGWDFGGQSNAALFMFYFMEDTGLDAVVPEDMTGEELLLLAYMVSMDDYFTMSPIETDGEGVLGMSGADLARLAAERVPEDFTVRLISALILSQEAMGHDWGKVFELCDSVMREDLDRNMRGDAIGIIMDYISLYYDYSRGIQ
ncbi:MAG: hypothetical protein AVO35_11230 [Candidatus Aegiribacteria sp. MLS_C]|nr:MAG: hypothetical protein AVO35_11230 [Candidatus Aegiribacteria sp. MLS_C]